MSDREQAVEAIRDEYGTLREYARVLGVHYASLSHALAFDEGYEKLFYRIAEEFNLEVPSL